MIVRRHIVRGANCILISVDLPLLLQEHSGAYCRAAGIDCYQEGRSRHTPHMSMEEFADIARQAFGKTFQIALGGAGNPNKHPDFEKMLKTCRFYRIVPLPINFSFLIAQVFYQVAERRKLTYNEKGTCLENKRAKSRFGLIRKLRFPN